MAPMILSLRNEKKGKTHNVSIQRIKDMPEVVTSTGASSKQKTILHLDDLVEFLGQEKFQIEAEIFPSRPMDVQWLRPSGRMLRKLSSWTRVSVIEAFRQLTAAEAAWDHRPADLAWMRLRDPNEDNKDDDNHDDDEEEQQKHEAKRARLREMIHRPVPLPRSSIQSKRKRSITTESESETETETDEAWSEEDDNDHTMKKKMARQEEPSEEDVQYAAHALASMAASISPPSSPPRPAPINTRPHPISDMIRPQPHETTTTMEQLSPRSRAYTVQLQATLCLSVLPWSPISVSIPVIDKNTNEMKGLLLPLAWLNFVSRQISTSSIARNQPYVDFETLQEVLKVRFTKDDIRHATELTRSEILEGVVETKPASMQSAGLPESIMIGRETFEMLARWFHHKNFKKVMRRLQTAKSIWMVNLLDWAIRYDVRSEPSFNYYLASAYMRKACRTSRPCTWQELPSRLGDCGKLVAMFRGMLSMFATSAEERKELLEKYEANLHDDFAEKYATFSVIRV